MRVSARYAKLIDMNRPAPLLTEGAAPARFTAAEFLRMAELGAFNDMKVELDHGELVRMNPPHGAHASMQARVIVELVRAAGGSGLIIMGEVGVDLGEDTIRAFDAALVESGAELNCLLRVEDIRVGIEIAVASIDYDLGPKMRDYAAAGVSTYWVVDLRNRTIHVASDPQDGEYREVRTVSFGKPLAIPGSGETITLD